MLPSTCISSYRRCFTALALILFNAIFVTHFNYVQLLSIILFFLDLLCQGWIWSRGTTTPEQRYTWQLQKVLSPLAYSCFLTPCVYTNTRKVVHTHTPTPACLTGHVDVVKFLLEACKVNPFPKDRWVALQPVRIWVLSGSTTACWSEICVPSPRWNNTPMDEALHFGHHDVFKILQEYQVQYTPSEDSNNGKENRTVHKNLDGLL